MNVPIIMPPLHEPPLLSILMANYNYGHFIENAIRSVLLQSYPSFEIIVCDDGSQDNSLQVLYNNFSGNKKIQIISQANQGCGAALNAAWNQSQGNIIVFLDADDEMYPVRLERIYGHMRQPNIGMVIHKLIAVRNGAPLQLVPPLGVLPSGWLQPKIYRNGGAWRHVPISGLALRREVAQLIFPLPAASLRSEADGYIHTLAPLLTNVSSIQEALGTLHIHNNNITSSSSKPHISSERWRSGYERIYQSVNQTLANFGQPPLDLQLNLEYMRAEFLSSLFKPVKKRILLSKYISVVYSMINDTSLTLPYKIFLCIFYLIILSLPTNITKSLFRKFGGYNRSKSIFRRIFSRTLTT